MPSDKEKNKYLNIKIIKPKLIKYKTGSDFGELDKGSIIDSYLLLKNKNIALIYHPKEILVNSKVQKGCGCFSICKFKDNIYSNYHNNSWVNVGEGSISTFISGWKNMLNLGLNCDKDFIESDIKLMYTLLDKKEKLRINKILGKKINKEKDKDPEFENLWWYVKRGNFWEDIEEIDKLGFKNRKIISLIEKVKNTKIKNLPKIESEAEELCMENM